MLSLLFLLALALAPRTQAQENPVPAGEESAAAAGDAEQIARTREALRSFYAGGLLAWFVEGRCRTLAQEAALRFEWDMGMLTRALLQMGVADQEISALQQASAEAAGDEQAYPCGADETTAYIAKGLKAADTMVTQLTGARYDPQSAWLDRYGLLYEWGVAALAVASLCEEMVSAQDRQRFTAAVKDGERRAQANGLRLGELRAAALAEAGRIKACDASAEHLLATARSVYDQLSP